MQRTDLPADFNDFLIEAKRRTYAGADDEATLPDPRLEGSTQLEWRVGDWFYRDVYFGMSAFSGLETVYLKDRPLWSMAYSGGTTPETGLDQTRAIYRFLRSALRALPRAFPVRGPAALEQEGFAYRMRAKGDLRGFSGVESVRLSGETRYRLGFAGGALR